MTDQHLVAVQNLFFEEAKDHLRTDSQLFPVAFVFTTKAKLDGLHEAGMAFEFMKLKDFAAYQQMQAENVVVVVHPRVLSWKMKYQALYREAPPGIQAKLTALMAQGKTLTLTEDQLFEPVVRPLMALHKVDDAAIIRGSIRQLCRAAQPFALLQMSEVYMLEVGANRSADAPADYADDPRSIEAVASGMETAEFRRMVQAPIIRRDGKRGEGVVIGFGDERVLDSRQGTPFSSDMFGFIGDPTPIRRPQPGKTVSLDN